MHPLWAVLHPRSAGKSEKRTVPTGDDRDVRPGGLGMMRAAPGAQGAVGEHGGRGRWDRRQPPAGSARPGLVPSLPARHRGWADGVVGQIGIVDGRPQVTRHDARCVLVEELEPEPDLTVTILDEPQLDRRSGLSRGGNTGQRCGGRTSTVHGTTSWWCTVSTIGRGGLSVVSIPSRSGRAARHVLHAGRSSLARRAPSSSRECAEDVQPRARSRGSGRGGGPVSLRRTALGLVVTPPSGRDQRRASWMVGDDRDVAGCPASERTSGACRRSCGSNAEQSRGDCGGSRQRPPPWPSPGPGPRLAARRPRRRAGGVVGQIVVVACRCRRARRREAHRRLLDDRQPEPDLAVAVLDEPELELLVTHGEHHRPPRSRHGPVPVPAARDDVPDVWARRGGPG